MYEYEINVAKDGRHASLIKLGRVSEAEAIEAAKSYEQAFGYSPKYQFTLYRVPVQMRERIEF